MKQCVRYREATSAPFPQLLPHPKENRICFGLGRRSYIRRQSWYARKMDAVVVYRYDRFARSLRQLVNALAEFDALGIHFISLHEGVDTSTPNSRLVFGIFASIAEFERELIRSRVRSGIAAAKARGRRIGRPAAPVSDTDVRVLLASGLSMQAAAERLGVSAATISRRVRTLSI